MVIEKYEDPAGDGNYAVTSCTRYRDVIEKYEDPAGDGNTLICFFCKF